MTRSITLITGSTLGTAEYLADHLADCLEQQGFEVTVENQANFTDVADSPLWLIVSSTYGMGDVPDNLKLFLEEIEYQDLSHVRFGILCLGHSDYDLFCGAADKIEQALVKQSAVLISDVLKLDTKTIDDLEQAAESWLPTFIEKI